MRILEYIREAAVTLWNLRWRSALTLVGMTIGIAATATILGISSAAVAGLRAQIAASGDPGATIQADPSQDDPLRAAISYRDVPRLVALSDGLIARAIPLDVQEVPLRTPSGTITVTVISSDGARQNSGLVPISGRLLDPDDVVDAASNVLLTEDAARRIFSGSDAVDRTFPLGKGTVHVAGVVTVRGTLLSGLTGAAIFIPYTTDHRLFPGPLSRIEFWPAPGVPMRTAMDAARRALQEIHGPHARYLVQDQNALTGIFLSVLSAISTGLTAIAAIASLVAGIGIANVMLVSVNERVREIGIRKSVGATRREIGAAFVLEACLLSLTGGVTGFALGALVIAATQRSIATALGDAPVPWGFVATVTLGFALIVGLVAGAYPAYQAAGLDPVEALRS